MNADRDSRRDHQRFLCLIEAVAFLHQHSRTRGVIRKGEQAIEHIEATLEDYRLAYSLACDVLGITLHELSAPRALQAVCSAA